LHRLAFSNFHHVFGHWFSLTRGLPEPL
jgi:hypothetical protein